MKYDIIENNKKKIGIFTDLHVGVESDSKIRINETKKCIEWVVKKFKENNIDWVVFCGDLYNSRYSINVNTLNVGIEIVQDLAFNFEKVILIEGNHDTYYKNSNSVNSISFLSNVSENENIIVVDEHPKFVKIANKTYGFYPWGFTPESIKDVEGFITPDYGFGHFELNGVMQAGQVSSGNKFSLHDMFILGNELFSGHYHTNNLYKDIKSGKCLHMVGSTLQLNWGDYHQDKMIGILDNGSYSEIVNDVNARFEKVFYSGFKGKKYTADALKNLCRRNFVKFVIDMPYQFEEILKCNEIIKKLNPYSLEFDYLISSTGVIEEQADVEIDNCKSKTNKEYLIEFLESIFEEYKNTDPSYDLDYLKELAISYFDKAMLPKSEREEQEFTGEEA